MPTKLRKSNLEGRLYTRQPAIELRLQELEGLTRDKLVELCEITSKSNPDYVPSECVLYFLRACRNDNSEAQFERLYKILAERVRRALPREVNADGATSSLAAMKIREQAFGQFIDLLSEDRQAYSEKLDYFELRFDGALANLRRDAQKKVWREARRTEALETDNSGEFSAEVEEAAGSFDPFVATAEDEENYRQRVAAAIDTLPELQRQIVHMLEQGFPIESKDKDVVSISQTLNRSEKTIRNQREKAFAVLRAMLKSGEE